MELLIWVFGQLLSYSPVSWAIWIVIAFIAARYFPGWCIPIGHLLVGAIVSFLDVRWIQGEMHKPGWDGVPDQDIVFIHGMLIRIVLINTVLLPVSFLGVWLRDRKRNPELEQAS